MLAIFESVIKSIPIVILCGLLLYLGCTRESFITSPDARIRLSADTLKYDTVFVSSGSIVQTFKIVNENKEKLRLSSVRLAGGTASAYKINVDGTATTEARDLVLEAQDSLYVFVQVNINPATGNLPFIVRDSVEITYNGNRKWLQLEAWGQQAHFLRNHEVTANETWQNESWKYTGNTNNWTLASADEELGYFYIPTGTPTNDWYGGHRLGNDLFAETLLEQQPHVGFQRAMHLVRQLQARGP